MVHSRHPALAMRKICRMVVPLSICQNLKRQRGVKLAFGQDGRQHQTNRGKVTAGAFFYPEAHAHHTEVGQRQRSYDDATPPNSEPHNRPSPTAACRLHSRFRWATACRSSAPALPKRCRREHYSGSLHLPRLHVAPQDQPALRTGQSVPYANHPHCGKVGDHWPLTAFFDRVARPCLGWQRGGAPHHRVRLWLPLSQARARRSASPARPHRHSRCRALPPHTGVVRHFGVVPRPRLAM